MKYFLILSLMTLFVYQLASVHGTPNSRQKRAQARGECPANATTEKECLDYIDREIFNGNGKGCSRVTTNGKFFEIASCGSVSCVIDGKEMTPAKEDLSKPYPDCCPRC